MTHIKFEKGLDKYKHLIVLGAQRSGTTFLYRLLNAHPKIQMAEPMAPEPKFFLKSSNNSYYKYIQQYFSAIGSGTQYLGEKSTSYYESLDVIDRIKKMLPKAKLFLQLRNPVERALSNYHFSVKNGLETRSIRQVFIERIPAPSPKMSTSVDPFDYLGRSDYLKYIQAYQKAFPSNLAILKFEEVTQGLADAVWNKLELDSVQYTPKIDDINAAFRSKVDDEVLQHLARYFKPRIEQIEDYLCEDFEIWK